jgi:hypothetical protein
MSRQTVLIIALGLVTVLCAAACGGSSIRAASTATSGNATEPASTSTGSASAFQWTPGQIREYQSTCLENEGGTADQCLGEVCFLERARAKASRLIGDATLMFEDQLPDPPQILVNAFADSAETDNAPTCPGIREARILGAGVASSTATETGTETHTQSQTTTSAGTTTTEPTATDDETTTSTAQQSSTETEPTPSAAQATEPCGDGIYADPNTTSCAFALNVYHSFAAAGSRGLGTPLMVNSPVTRQNYVVTCKNYGGSGVFCTTATGSLVLISGSAQ